jgi:hypothetical protein
MDRAKVISVSDVLAEERNKVHETCSKAVLYQVPESELNDGEARDFMVASYKTWLSQARSDPAKALRDTQLSWLQQDKLRDPRVWAPYVLIE